MTLISSRKCSTAFRSGGYWGHHNDRRWRTAAGSPVAADWPIIRAHNRRRHVRWAGTYGHRRHVRSIDVLGRWRAHRKSSCGEATYGDVTAIDDHQATGGTAPGGATKTDAYDIGLVYSLTMIDR